MAGITHDCSSSLQVLDKEENVHAQLVDVHSYLSGL